MPHVLVHTAALDDLAGRPDDLPPEMARALREDQVYGRFGAVLSDLPWFGLESSGLLQRLRGHSPPPPPFATLFHNGAPVAVGLRLAELVAGASLVGRDPGLAVVAGYFSHLALDRALKPPVADLARRVGLPARDPRDAAQLIERMQAYFFIRHREGRALPGWSGVGEKLRVLKRRGYPYGGVGRGLHLLVHRAWCDTLGLAPRKAELDGWVRGLYVYARLLSSRRAGRPFVLPEEAGALRPIVFKGEAYDYPALYGAALVRARHHIRLVHAYMVEGDFSRGAREVLFESLPEGSLA